MTMQELRDEFYQLRNDDPIFSDLYDANDFQNWLNDYCIGSDD
jgi:hypothetical protein